MIPPRIQRLVTQCVISRFYGGHLLKLQDISESEVIFRLKVEHCWLDSQSVEMDRCFGVADGSSGSQTVAWILLVVLPGLQSGQEWSFLDFNSIFPL